MDSQQQLTAPAHSSHHIGPMLPVTHARLAQISQATRLRGNQSEPPVMKHRVRWEWQSLQHACSIQHRCTAGDYVLHSNLQKPVAFWLQTLKPMKGRA